MQHTKRYLLVPEEIYQSLASPPPSDGTPIGLVRNRIKQIKNDDGINEAERAIKYEQELKRFNKLTRDEDERPVGVKLENLSDVVDAMPKSVNVRRPIVVATRRHLKVGRARKENVEQLEDDVDDDDDDHDHETPKPSSSNKRQPTQTEILKLIYKNAQSLGVSEEGQVLRAAIIMDLKKLRLLEFLYKDLSSPVAFTSVEPLLREARKTQPKINRTDVQNYLASQRTYTLHRQAKRRYRRLPTLAPGLHTEWQADLAIFDRLAKQNSGYKYLLVCVDTLSRQVFVEPVKTKTSTNMIIAFGRIFKRSKYIPWKVLTDQGKEFTARAVQHFFRAKDVEHFCMLTSPQFHAGMAERANRSIKERVYRYFTERNTYKWIDLVQDIVRAINHSPNSTIGMCPADVNFKNAEALRQKLHNAAENVVRRQPRYRVGDRVRIEKYKHVFQKGYLPRFTNELFTVAEVHTERSPVVYRLRDDHNEIISEKETERGGLCMQQWINNEHGVGQIRLVVFEKEQEYRIVFKGEGLAAKFNLCLVLERGHFNYIGRVEQLFDVPNYCIDCERRADARYHAFGCKVACRLCLRYGPGYPCHTEQLPNGGSTARKCADCQFVFPNDGCYNFHLANNAPAPMDGRGQRQRQPICQWRRVCRACGRVAYVSTHQCPRDQPADDGICQRCNGPHTVDEPCYIQPIDDGSVQQRALIALDNDDSDDDDDDDDDLPLRLCFFDAETSQDTPLQLNNRTVQKHVPLLIVAEVICERCLQAGITVNDGLGRRAPGCVCMTGMVRGQLFRQWSSPPFANAPGDNSASPVGAPAFNQRRFFFHSFDNDGSDPVDQFLDFLLHHGPKKAHTVCIAHNGGKYDFHLVLEALHRRNRPPKHLCTTGLKIYSMSLSGRHQRRITFKDSINYFFCALDALVKSFDVPDHLATLKPFFPYLYIRRQHLSQRLINLPAQEFYAPDTMKAEKRAQFLRWHADNNGNGFQLREQLIMYCVNDVAILRESVIRFRQLIADNTQGLDPFLHASTAAGLALATFRRCFLPANRLVHSPEGGYLRGRRASAESQRYIRFFELEHPEAQVQCASWSVGEAHIEDSGYRVDGLWRRDGALRPLAIEWLGCYYHGCRVCFPDRQQQLAAGRTAEDLYERTERRLFELEHDHGCDLHVVWACQWAERLRHDPDLKRRYDAVFVPCPLDPRNDALRGGRTEPFKLHHVCSDDEEIMCIDIVSLYPYVMVLLRPPTAPLPWTAPETNIFRGLLLVRVLAPRNIRVPLLGYRTKDGRFTFPLCAWCADRRQQRPCRHDDDKRSWVTAYTHVELNKALQLGYVVTDLFEVWDYEEWDGTLFSSYVNTFVGLKVQATGWPEGCVTDEQQKAFVDEFERTEGIRLDSTKMEFNPGLRLIAKTLANSLWGKLAQRVGQTEIRYTRTPAEFHALLDDPTLDKLDFVHVSEHMDRSVVRKRPEFGRAPLTNCLPVAAFVTSYGRLHLYDYMEQVSAIDGAELLYCDTDSIYYVNKMGGPCVAEGEALGQMKREHTDRRIVEFVAGGPKNYGIRHTARDGTDEHANLKIRSFRLSYTAQQLLTFEAMKDLTLATYNIDGPIDDALDNDDLYVYGGGEHRAIRVNFPQIDRNVYADLYTHEAHKDYRPFYAKGRVRPGMQTCPFGYVEDDGQPNEGQRTHRRKRNFVEQDPTQPGLNTDNVDHTQLVDAQCDALCVLDAPQNACRHFTRTAWVWYSGENHTRRLEYQRSHSFARFCTDAHDDSMEAPGVILCVCATLRNCQELLSS
ncbi:hypothetical protein niasHS_004876 [Heterodera schachtii]|uniref:DNA-directed DNA polymerase n=1 Tax=Heterodera schachtii TaxID=97005 RepID=A0ABD2JLI3_HETSC